MAFYLDLHLEVKFQNLFQFNFQNLFKVFILKYKFDYTIGVINSFTSSASI